MPHFPGGRGAGDDRRMVSGSEVFREFREPLVFRGPGPGAATGPRSFVVAWTGSLTILAAAPRMTAPDLHTFHIPVMGLAFTIDTPLKVARFGISSVVSIVEDNLVEQMRAFHCAQAGEAYVPIPTDDIDHRAKRTRHT